MGVVSEKKESVVHLSFMRLDYIIQCVLL